MVKGFAVSALLVLLLSSVSVGAITQFQGFTIGAGQIPMTNGVYAAGPDSSSTSTNALTVAQDQLASERAGHVTAFQGESGSLVQSAAVIALCGDLGIQQTGLAVGGQAQSHPGNCCSIGNNDQFLNANLTQASIGNGLGTGLGLQNFVGFQTQLTFTMFGASANTQSVGVTTFDAFGGCGNGPAVSVIGNRVGFGLGQTQAP